MDNDTPTSPGATSSGTGELSRERLEEFRQGFEADASKKLLQNVVTQHDVNDVALSRSVVADSPH